MSHRMPRVSGAEVLIEFAGFLSSWRAFSPETVLSNLLLQPTLPVSIPLVVCDHRARLSMRYQHGDTGCAGCRWVENIGLM